MADSTYGTRLEPELTDDGEHVAIFRIGRLMREHGCVAVELLLLRKTTDSIYTLDFAPNLLQQGFSTRSLHRVWISTGEGWCYRRLARFVAPTVAWALV